MKHIDDENGFGEREQSPVVFRMGMREFQKEVIEKLGRLEAKMDMLAGGPQPGRMKMAEDRIRTLENNDIRRGVYDRLISAMIATIISVAIAMHDHFFK
jgi:hypothetical protein